MAKVRWIGLRFNRTFGEIETPVEKKIRVAINSAIHSAMHGYESDTTKILLPPVSFYLSRVRFMLCLSDSAMTIVDIFGPAHNRIGFGHVINQSLPLSTVDVDRFRLWFQSNIVGFQTEIPIEAIGIWELDDQDQIVQIL